MTEQELLRKTGELEAARIAVQNLDNALSLLTPEERLVANLLLLHPQRGNVQQLCQLLHVEQAAVYRRRKKVINKLLQTLNGI